MVLVNPEKSKPPSFRKGSRLPSDDAVVSYSRMNWAAAYLLTRLVLKMRDQDAKPRPVERDPERERYDAEVERELRQQEAEREERRLAGERVKNGDSDESPPPLPAQPPPVSASVHPNPNSRLRMGPAYKAEEDTSKPKLIPYSNAAQAAGGASGHGAQPTKGVSTLAPTPAQAHAQVCGREERGQGEQGNSRQWRVRQFGGGGRVFLCVRGSMICD